MNYTILGYSLGVVGLFGGMLRVLLHYKEDTKVKDVIGFAIVALIGGVILFIK